MRRRNAALGILSGAKEPHMVNTTEADNLIPSEELTSDAGEAEAPVQAEEPAAAEEPSAEAAAEEQAAATEAPASPEGEAADAPVAEAAAEETAGGEAQETEPSSEEEASELLKPLPGAVTGPEVMTRSRYALVVLAAKRAKQLREGARRLGSTTATNYLTAALEEAAEGVIGYRLADEETPDANDD
jgi:DNA-directed RNA polymerase omega subunit